MVSLPVATLLMVTLSEEHIFVSTVSGEGYRRNAETWKASLEAVPSGEWSCVPPLFSVQSKPHIQRISRYRPRDDGNVRCGLRSCPRVSCWSTRRRCEFIDIESSESSPRRSHC